MPGKIVCRLMLLLFICGLLPSLEAQGVAATIRNTLDQEKINRAIQLHIEKNMPWPVGSMRFEVLSRLPEIVMPPTGSVTWRVDTKGNDDYLGECYFVLKLFHNGVLEREESIRVRIEMLREFFVSAKNLGRDSIISTGDISLQKRWVRTIPLNSISSMEEVEGKLLCVNVRPNTEITRNMLKEVTAVKRGKMVQITLDSGPINITTMGLSEEDGSEGAFVKVRNTSSNKIIYARVIGESRVKVDFK
jgi:flagellar basal body P-ring formation protein FlgA